jgi:hypothetical protein
MPNVYPVLGLWHTYKFILEQVFQKHLPLLFGRVFHTLFPKAFVPKKPKHVTAQTMCLQLLAAWPSVRVEMAELANDNTLAQQHHARSICTLINVIIPAVRCDLSRLT